jgi:hypothetical protein
VLWLGLYESVNSAGRVGDWRDTDSATTERLYRARGGWGPASIAREGPHHDHCHPRARQVPSGEEQFRRRQDLDSVFRCIPHELGHFVTRSTYEGNAEFAAETIRKRAREACTVPFE